MSEDCATNRMGRVKSYSDQINIGVALGALVLLGMLATPVRAADEHQAAEPRTQAAPAAQKTDATAPKADPLPQVDLSGEIFYRVLVAEVAAQRHLYDIGAQILIDLAKETRDPRLAHRGLEFELAGSNLSGAFEAARIWARLAPDNIEASSTELALAAANGQTSGLAQALRQRIDMATDKVTAITQAVAVLSRLNDRRLALRILDEALDDAALKLPIAHVALADVAAAAGDTQRAAAEAHAALAIDPQSDAAAQRVLVYGLKVDAPRALTEARAYIERNPDARKVRLMLVDVLANKGDYSGAMAELQEMARRAPEDFDLLYMQAQLAYRGGQLAQARTWLAQYLEVQKQRQRDIPPGATDAQGEAADARLLLARIDEDQGRFDEAVQELDLIDDVTLRYGIRMRQAVLRAKQGRFDEALSIIERAVPNDADERVQGVLVKAQILRQGKGLSQAVTALRKADRELPDTSEIKYELAMLYEQQGRIAEMERLLRQVMKLDPDNAHAYNALGYTLADRNRRLPEALNLITQALELAPDDPFILDSMGWVKFRMGDLAKAADYLRRAYELRPEVDIAVHLAEVLWRQGQREEAKQLLRAAQSKAPENATLQETLKRLKITL